MERLILVINKQLTVHRILISFWFLFWLLNGLDKFFNGDQFFGVTRDEKFVSYFSSINLSADFAFFALYTCGIAETILGVAFLFCLLSTGYKALLLLNLKVGMLIFVTFSSFDILFGDRMELWEHGTFLAIALLSWMFFKMKFSDERPQN